MAVHFIGWVAVAAVLFSPVARAADLVTLDYRHRADEMRTHFDRHVLHTWFPRCVDFDHGGFRSSFSREWVPAAKQDRFLVFQARMTWLSAQVAMKRPERKAEFLKYTRHGVAILQKMWDPEQGGLYWGLTEDAKVDPKYGTRKHVYGIAFGIYAAAAAHEATGDAAALDLAMNTFLWLDRHAHDDANGGYHEALERDGTPIRPKDLGQTISKEWVGPNQAYGYKSMNSHIHLLEAFTELYRVKKDDAVRRRLEELFLIVRDKIAVEPGCLNLFFTPDWRPVPDHDSFGHDIETAYLLTEAAEALGRAEDEQTRRVARQLVDHALDWGFDDKNGGFYDRGAAFDKAHDTRKVWWTQAEGLNALLLMHERHGLDTPRYWKAFAQTWTFVQDHVADKQFGGWYETTNAAGIVLNPAKAQNWKAGYHDGRALLNMEARLWRLGR